jgi:hypothetical protein
MLISKIQDHAVHQKSLEKQMGIIKAENEGIKLTVTDYAEKLGIGGVAIANIRELFDTGRF